MRKDPPFDTEFIYCTYILERAEEKGTLIVNKPQSLRDCNEKLYTAWFSDLTPDTRKIDAPPMPSRGFRIIFLPLLMVTNAS